MKRILKAEGNNFKSTTFGFTLVELLVVISVLGIVALISTPIITDILEKSKKNAFSRSAYGILESANNFYAQEIMKNNNFNEATFTVKNESMTFKNYKLDINGVVPIGNSQVIISSDGRIYINITDGSYRAIKEFDEEGISISKE